MSITGFFTLLLFVVSLTVWYVMKEESFEERDPTLLLMTPFFMILFMIGYVLTLQIKTSVNRIFLPIQ